MIHHSIKGRWLFTWVHFCAVLVQFCKFWHGGASASETIQLGAHFSLTYNWGRAQIYGAPICINVMRLGAFQFNLSIKWYQIRGCVDFISNWGSALLSSSSPHLVVIPVVTAMSGGTWGTWKFHDGTGLVLSSDFLKLISMDGKYVVKLSLVGCQKSRHQRNRSFLRASNFYAQSNYCDSRSRQVLFNSMCFKDVVWAFHACQAMAIWCVYYFR